MRLCVAGTFVYTEYASRRRWWDEGDGTLNISPELGVTRYILFEPMPYAEVLRYAYLEYNPTVVSASIDVQQPWQGFGEVQVRVRDW